ncbi:hypothetical protein M0813_17030 [Anaeramoeba flamelloides]|uniref:Uncharacterized protein n=1 Tax=Anaeramoeba flamelloides TaxID=1746091 RepID=A0ABQ8YYH8_9EUKA|nr:hypothetical protein M0813_17030 [Anaeramoeba flamelloides]
MSNFNESFNNFSFFTEFENEKEEQKDVNSPSVFDLSQEQLFSRTLMKEELKNHFKQSQPNSHELLAWRTNEKINQKENNSNLGEIRSNNQNFENNQTKTTDSNSDDEYVPTDPP